MTTPVVMPKQGNSVESCLIMAWKKNVGDSVQPGDVLLEIETDKAAMEVESLEAGVLLAQFFKAGDEVPVMTNIAVIGPPGADVEPFRPAAPAKSRAATPSPAAPSAPAPAPTTTNSGDVFISPRAQQLAQRHGLPLSTITPTGPEGRIIERDVQSALAQRPRLTRAAQAAAGDAALPSVGSGLGGRVTVADLEAASQPAPTAADAVTTVPLQGIRQIIAERMTASLQQMAQLTLNASADARALLAYRQRLKHSAPHLGLQNISINDLLLWVVSRVLLDYPELNATLEQNVISQHSAVHLGFAVDTPRGLLVPVVHHAHQRSLKQLSAETKRLVTAIQDGKVTPDALKGGTFTVTNLGSLGIESFTPIINPPQVAILGVGQIDLKAVQGKEAVEFIPHMHLSLTIDHRAVDGAPAARFLQALTGALAELELWLAL